MKEPKKILGLILIIVLLGSLGVMTYMLANGTSIMGFSLRASNSADEVDPFLADLNVEPTSPAGVAEEEPAPTVASDPEAGASSLLAYNSTSPTPTLVATVSASLTPLPTITLLPSETPTPTEFIEVVAENLTPTIITELPQTGITDHLDTILIGGGILILIAFIL